MHDDGVASPVPCFTMTRYPFQETSGSDLRWPTDGGDLAMMILLHQACMHDLHIIAMMMPSNSFNP
jgi:hypothetical protein